jgi:lipoprotein-anchoring transpeptidase ErfK/SrfK
MRAALFLGLFLVSAGAGPCLAKIKTSPLTLESINAAHPPAGKVATKGNPAVIRAQALLARRQFSPGVIDGSNGENFQKALRAFQRKENMSPTGKLDDPTWAKLTGDADEAAFTVYAIEEADAKGPFVRAIPKDYEKMAELDMVGYRSARELLAEKFHMSESLLEILNKKTDLTRAGAQIIVANVGPTEATARSGRKDKGKKTSAESAPEVSRIEINKAERALRVFDDRDQVIAYYPASIGSEEKPAPSGRLTVQTIARNPTYRYDPKYKFKGQKAESPVEVPPGPNNPVGLVWIGLSAESYGIHGTPAPENIGKTESHGCVRLTNWDALALAKLARKGLPVDFVD